MGTISRLFLALVWQMAGSSKFANYCRIRDVNKYSLQVSDKIKSCKPLMPSLESRIITDGLENTVPVFVLCFQL